MQLSLEDYHARSLELRCLRGWFKRFPFRSKRDKSLGWQEETNKVTIPKTFWNKWKERTMFEHWKVYVLHKLRRRKAICKAIYFYRTRIQRKAFDALLRNAIANRAWLVKAIDYSNGKIRRRYFNLWINYFKTRKDRRYSIRKAESFYKAICLRKFMRVWEKFASKRKRRKLLEYKFDKACRFYENNLLKNSIKIWTTLCDFESLKIKLNTADTYYDRRVLEKSLGQWKKYLLQKKCRRRKIFLLKNLYMKRLVIDAFRKLKSYAIYRKQKKARLAPIKQRSSRIIDQLQSIYLNQWRSALCTFLQDKRKFSQAVELWEFRLSQKYFRHWKTFSMRHKEILMKKKNLQGLATGFLLKKYVLLWQERCNQVLKFREKETAILSTFHKKILMKHFALWKKYIRYRKLKNKDIEAAMELNRKFVLREGLKKILKTSLLNVEENREIQFTNAITKFSEDFETLREYFDRWLSGISMGNKSLIEDEDHDVYHHEKYAGLVLPVYMIPGR